MSSTPSISNIPEELRQHIASYLNYDDAWALKQTSWLFFQVIEIPTIASFLDQPWGPSLEVLEDWAVVPLGYEPCYYCRRFLPLSLYDRKQRQATVARQDCEWSEFDYTTWLPEQHYCLDCGVENHKYVWGETILTGFGDPGNEDESIVPCSHCGIIMDLETICCGHCSACEECVNMAWLVRQNHEDLTLSDQVVGCGHKEILAAMEYLPRDTVDIYQLQLTDPADFDEISSPQFFTPRSSMGSVPPPRPSSSAQEPSSPAPSPISRPKASSSSPTNYLKQARKVMKRIDSVLRRSKAIKSVPAAPFYQVQSGYDYDYDFIPVEEENKQQTWFCEPAITAGQPWGWI